MAFLGAQTFGFIPAAGSGGPAPSTPDWQAVTDVGNTTNKDIFVQDTTTPTPNIYLKVDKTNELYFLGDGATGSGVLVNAGISRQYTIGEQVGIGAGILLNGFAPSTIYFYGTTLYQFNDSIAVYANGEYSAVVYNAGSKNMEIQPKDMVPQKVVTADYPATVSDCILNVQTSGSDITITLPTSVLPGKRFFIKFGVGTDNVIVAPASGLIDGAASKTLSILYESLEVVFDGTNYFIL